MTDYREEWLWHVREPIIGLKAFPRDISDANLRRYTADTKGNYFLYCNQSYKNKTTAHTSVYSDWEWQNHIASCLFLDIDGKNAIESFEYVTAMRNELLTTDIDPMVVATGGKGYHLFVLFDPIVIGDLRGATLHFLRQYDWWGSHFDRVIDPRKIGDWRAICRVPRTMHRYGEHHSSIKDKGSVTGGSEKLARELSKYYSTIITNGERKIVDLLTDSELGTSTGVMPPCIRQMLDNLKEGELDHNHRIQLVLYLFKCGFKKDEIHNILAMASDYDYNMTDYQLNYLVERTMRLYSCDAAKELGMCPCKCEYYPTMNTRV